MRLENYRFSGVDASVVGALKSVADYYRMPLTTSWIYGTTGLAFLHVLDDNLAEPNGGPPEPDIFRLARNIGLKIEGMHEVAEGERFRALQREAWEKARQAIGAQKPVFAKNIDIGNQTSVVLAYDEIGYYTDSWHTGFEHSEDVIPWSHLGLSRCTCINCVNDRETVRRTEPDDRGLISLHWATPIQPADDHAAIKQALAYVIRLNEQGNYSRSGTTCHVGSAAYETWLAALQRKEVDQYFFSLFLEILYEARTHAVMFLREMKGRIPDSSDCPIDDAIRHYGVIADSYKTLKEMYPYQEPRRSEVQHIERCMAIVTELYRLEQEGLRLIRDIHASL